ncbi:MAG: hypothetical protein ACXIUM_02055 [Wenzhouxiangella sp.]
MLPAVSSMAQGLHAPLFERLITELSSGRRHVILDCGAARSGTLALLSAFRCRLDVVHLAELLPRLRQADDPDHRQQLLAARLAGPDSEPGHLVLCWNLLNYLQPAEIEVLAAVLASRLVPGARLHALIEYSSPTMPASPGHWVPDAAGRLHADQPDIEETRSPRYSPKALERLMPQFRPERSMLLGNGLQEHLFLLRSDSASV